jgi:hypothetical protein
MTILKTLNKRLVLYFLTLLLTANVFAQKKSFPGYYIDKQNDSIRGIFSNYAQWSNSPSSVQFIPSGSSANIELTPENTSKFSIDNYDTYISFSGERLTNPIDPEQIFTYRDVYGFDDKYEHITGFLRLIAKTGNFEAYAYTDKLRTNFFYRLGSEPLKELRFKMYYYQNQLTEVNDYRQQLSTIFKDEVSKRNINVDFTKINYTEESIASLVQKLTPVEKRKKLKNPASGIVVAAGVSTNFFKVKGDNTIDEVNSKYKTSLSPIISVGYMYVLNRNFGKYFLYPLLKLYNYKSSGQQENTYFNTTTTFQTSLVIEPVINVGMNFINSQKLRWFGSFGAGMAGLVNNKEVVYSVRTNDNSASGSKETPLAELSYIFNTSSGVTINNKWIVAATYNFPAAVAGFAPFDPLHSSLQITLGYKFK